jgi:thymidine kinase
MALELVCGPMFSGKTGLLIERLAAADELGLRALALKPAADTRSASLVTHSGGTYPATTWRPGEPLPLGDAEVLALDEAQFVDVAHVSALVDAAAERTLVVAGLDLDFRREPFPIVADLERVADVVHRLTATCSLCLRPAPFTQRLVDGRPADFGDETVRIGADELYQPRCGPCYEAERDPSGDARTVRGPWRSLPR